MNAAIIAIALVGAVLSTVFVIAYHIMTRGGWRDSSAGWWLMLGRANIAVLCYLVVVNRTVGDWPGREVVTLVLFAFFAAQTMWPIRLLWNDEHTAIHRRETEDDLRTGTRRDSGGDQGTDRVPRADGDSADGDPAGRA